MLGGDTARVPLGSLGPVQPPPAVHEVAFVEDQFAIDIWPEVMLVGLAENATVGAETVPPPPFDPGEAGTPPAPESPTFTFVTTMP